MALVASKPIVVPSHRYNSTSPCKGRTTGFVKPVNMALTRRSSQLTSSSRRPGCDTTRLGKSLNAVSRNYQVVKSGTS